MKATYTLLILFFIGFSCDAQKYRAVYKLGIEGGPSLTKLRGNEYLNANYISTIAYATGLSFQVLVPKKSLSFKTNLFYEKKGAVTDDIFITDATGSVRGTTNNSISLTYITIPAMLRVRTKGRVGVFANAGGFVGFLLKDETVIGAKDTMPQQTIDNTEKDNKLDGGFSFGAGLEIPIKEKFTLSFELRDNIGVYDINNTPRTRGGSVQTNSINFLFGLAYRLNDPYRRRFR